MLSGDCGYWSGCWVLEREVDYIGKEITEMGGLCL
jgi:hypothetical protein